MAISKRFALVYRSLAGDEMSDIFKKCMDEAGLFLLNFGCAVY